MLGEKYPGSIIKFGDKDEWDILIELGKEILVHVVCDDMSDRIVSSLEFQFQPLFHALNPPFRF